MKRNGRKALGSKGRVIGEMEHEFVRGGGDRWEEWEVEN